MAVATTTDFDSDGEGLDSRALSEVVEITNRYASGLRAM